MLERLAHASEPRPIPDDATLAHKVESELFRDPSIPKGRMNVNVENGVVILRGVAQSSEQIERIIATTMATEDVRSVRSLLRLPDEPEPGSVDRAEEHAPAHR